MGETVDLLKLAQEIRDINTQSQIEQIDGFKELANTLASIEIGDDITKPLLALLTLPDEQFNLIAPIILVDFNKNFHDSNNQLLMLQTFNASGIRLEDFQMQINELMNEIDEEEQSLSSVKRNFLKQIFLDLFNSISEIKGIPKRVINIPIELINEDAKIPVYANPTDAGVDLYAIEDITIHPGETLLIPTGIKVAIPVGYELQIRPKSGRTVKTKLRIGNTPGTIDSGFREEIKVIVENIEAPIKKIYLNDNGTITAIDYGSSYTIGKGEKFAQMVLNEIAHCAFQQITNIMDIPNDGRNGGFGSTGDK